MTQDASQVKESRDQSRHTPDPQRARVEWATLLVSAVLLLAVVAVLTAAQFTGGDTAPSIEARIEPDQTRRDGDAYHVSVNVRNRGRAGARDVQLRVAPSRPTGTSDESVDLTLDLLPPGASESAVVVLRTDPSRVPVEARVVSYITD